MVLEGLDWAGVEGIRILSRLERNADATGFVVYCKQRAMLLYQNLTRCKDFNVFESDQRKKYLLIKYIDYELQLEYETEKFTEKAIFSASRSLTEWCLLSISKVH